MYTIYALICIDISQYIHGYTFAEIAPDHRGRDKLIKHMSIY